MYEKKKLLIRIRLSVWMYLSYKSRYHWLLWILLWLTYEKTHGIETFCSSLHFKPKMRILSNSVEVCSGVFSLILLLLCLYLQYLILLSYFYNYLIWGFPQICYSNLRFKWTSFRNCQLSQSTSFYNSEYGDKKDNLVIFKLARGQAKDIGWLHKG